MKYDIQPTLAPPSFAIGLVGWLRKNLFSSVNNSIATLIVAALLIHYLTPILNWTFFQANWIGSTRDDCSAEGACWVFIVQRLDQFLYGFYPSTETWRLDLIFFILVGLLVWLASPRVRYKKYVAACTVLLFPFISYYLLNGGAFGLVEVDTHKWGGLSLTLVLAVVGISASLPFGILLALGRQSEMPIVRAFSVIFIEVWRGVPLITVLFMASVMLPLFFPEEMNFDKLVRALIGITMFQSAYMAEVVRGGLQAIPKGQYEAADALGLGYWRKMGLIVLPQALKLMIPGIVNTFIALFKDTSLVLIIGLFDLLAIVQAATNDPEWIGYATEGYIFAGFVFWLFCFLMSRYSQHLEKKLKTDHTAAN